MRKVFSLLLALMLVFSLAVPAFAAGNKMEYGSNNRIYLTAGAATYTDSDLFGNFKNVMPGDVLKTQLTITNVTLFCDVVKVSMEAIPHGDTNLPSKKVQESGETVASMQDFLKQMNLKVSCGDWVIFNGSPNLGFDSVTIANLTYMKSATLDIELTVPTTMGNEYANRIGEVDWVFTFQGFKGETPRTGDTIMTAVTVMAVSGVALGTVLAVNRKKKKH